MSLPLLTFAQKCLTDIDHDYLTFFDLRKGIEGSFSTYPSLWIDRYLSQKYYETDYAFTKKSLLPFAWGEFLSPHLSGAQKHIFKEAQDFQITKGITAPLFPLQTSGVLSIAFHKKERLTQAKILTLGSDLQFSCQLIMAYQNLLEINHKTDEFKKMNFDFMNQVTSWKKNHQKRKKDQYLIFQEILSNIKAAQLFIAHHETKELALETLHRTYKNIERLI